MKAWCEDMVRVLAFAQPWGNLNERSGSRLQPLASSASSGKSAPGDDSGGGGDDGDDDGDVTTPLGTPDTRGEAGDSPGDGGQSPGRYNGVAYRPRRNKWAAQVTARNIPQKLFIGEFHSAQTAAAAFNYCVTILERNGFRVKLSKNDGLGMKLPVSGEGWVWWWWGWGDLEVQRCERACVVDRAVVHADVSV